MRRWLDALASKDAISFWSWFIALVIALINARQLSMQYEIPAGRWVIAVLIVHAMLAPLLIVGHTLKSRFLIASSRVAFALSLFFSFGLLRALIMSLFVESETNRPLLSIFLPWMVSSSLIATVSMAGVALLVHGFRAHGDTMDRLSLLQRSLSFARTANKQSEQSIMKSLLDDVRGTINEQLRRLAIDQQAAPVRGADQLRLLAESVVRPISHQLLFSSGEQNLKDAATVSDVNSKVYGVREIVAKIRPVNYLFAPLFVESLVTPFLTFRYGPGITLWNLLLTTPTLILLSFLVHRMWPTKLMSVSKACLLGLIYCGIGIIAAFPIHVVVNAIGYSMPLYLSNGLFYLFGCSLFIVDDAIELRRREVQDQLAEVLQTEAIEVSSYRNRLLSAQHRLGKLLHSQVQGELVALALQAEIHGGRNLGKNAAEIEALISELLERIRGSSGGNPGAPQSAVDFRSQISDLIQLWSGALDISLDIDPELFIKLDQHEYLRNAVTDVIAEGLTNAVKHKNEPEVLVRIRESEGFCEIVIRSKGSLSRKKQNGAGTKILQESAKSVEVHDHDGFIELVARIA